MLHLRTASVDQTRDLAAALSELLRPDDLLLLAGDLGAGKTAFVQGLGRGLGVTQPITSPTFMLAQEYTGRLVLHHLDVYRLTQLEEVFDLGLQEVLDQGAVTVIEWGDYVTPVLPSDYAEVRLRLGDGDDDRDIEVRLVGDRWAARNRALRSALATWLTADPTC